MWCQWWQILDVTGIATHLKLKGGGEGAFVEKLSLDSIYTDGWQNMVRLILDTHENTLISTVNKFQKAKITRCACQGFKVKVWGRCSGKDPY